MNKPAQSRGINAMVPEGMFSEGKERAEEPMRTGAPAPAAGPSALPCLSSNNSIEPRPKLTPYQRKNAFILKENLEAMVAKYGLERIGFLTLTFPHNLTLREANKRFDSLMSNALSDAFEDWVNVREFTGIMRPHMHLVVATREDIRTGFNFENYGAMTALTKGKDRRKHSAEITRLSRSLNPSPALRSIWERLRAVLPRYKFGRHELIPIKKSSEALAFYVGGYISKSVAARPPEAKGARLVSYSQGFDRRVNGHAFQWNTERTALWRHKLAIFARVHRIKSFEGLSETFGPRWAFWFKDLIESLNPCNQPTNLPMPTFSPEEIERIGKALELHPQYLTCGPLHLYPPRPPSDEKGRVIHFPKELAPVFRMHADNWHLSEAELNLKRQRTTHEKEARLPRPPTRLQRPAPPVSPV